MVRTKEVDHASFSTRITCPSTVVARMEASPFPDNLDDSAADFEKFKKMMKRGVVHERTIHFMLDPNFMRDMIQGLGWQFMYNRLDRINITMAMVGHKMGTLELSHVLATIAKSDMRWDYFKPKSKKVNNAILTDKARGWQRLIVCNLQPMTHQTTSSMEQALLIYTMMSGGLLHLSRIMCDFMYHASKGPRDQRLPFPVLITRLATANGFAPSPEDEYLDIPAKDRDCPFGKSKGEKRKPRQAEIQYPSPPPIPPRLVHPHSPQAQPSAPASDIPTSSTTQPLDLFRQIMRIFRRQEHMILNSQHMIRTAHSDMEFTDLLQVSSPDPEPTVEGATDDDDSKEDESD
ncbi:hypothetical protein PIB30_040891 [Stylosanthes scabra]|uniref:Putative plant transposon protein domain-containing protein n=1 Tax=Stylosanthes scabra TaxID=79078 RepID=A0ABU6UDE7_9FABA|nr:hypothetical protein [Stylosanthes scabra]